MRILLLLTLLLAAPARAEDRAGDFTHYVLALSWNASWCALEGDRRGADQCDPRHDLGFTLHGLWPQGERGWPEHCRTRHADPSRAETAAMADIMGSGGLAWYQWKKHGRCADVSASEYFSLARAAWETIGRPDVLRRLDEAVNVTPHVIEQAFLEANPGMGPEQLSVTCKGGYVAEVRICLTKGLVPRACTPQVERGCREPSALFPPMR